MSKAIKAMLIVGVLLLTPLSPALAEPSQDQAAAEKLKRPIMTVTYAEIQGKVFLASARQGEEEEPAQNVRVQVRDLQNDKLLREAYTDKEGYYSLPKLEPAEYLMLIGAFKIQLVVRPETQSLTELPKILIVILPEEMVQSRDR